MRNVLGAKRGLVFFAAAALLLVGCSAPAVSEVKDVAPVPSPEPGSITVTLQSPEVHSTTGPTAEVTQAPPETSAPLPPQDDKPAPATESQPKQIPVYDKACSVPRSSKPGDEYPIAVPLPLAPGDSDSSNSSLMPMPYVPRKDGGISVVCPM